MCADCDTRDFDEDRAIADVTCPMCHADQGQYEALLGTLGTINHYRCRYCGIQWNDEHEDA